MNSKTTTNTIKKIIFSLIGLMMISQISIAQYSGWELVYSEISELGVVKEFSFVPGSNGLWEIGYAALFDGRILKTTDGGATWLELSAIVPEYIWGVSFADEFTGYLAGQAGSIYKTTDGGTSWTAVYYNSEFSFNKIAFKDTNNGVAVGFPNNIYTSDGGTTWGNAPGPHNYWRLDYAAGNTYYGVEAFSGEVGQTTDNGQTWAEAHNTTLEVTFCVNFFDSNIGLVGGQGGIVQVTNDGCSTWQNQSISDVEILAASWFDSDTVWTCGDGVFKSTDQGVTWVTDTTNFAPGTALYNREMFVTGMNTIVIGASSISTNDIQIWRKVGPPPIGADFEADTEIICTGGTVDFTDLSNGPIDSWTWTFEGGTPASSTEQNPSVAYNVAGEYDVKLVVTVGALLDSLTKVNYINALLLPDQAGQPSGDTDICTGTTVVYTTDEVLYAQDYDWEVSPSSAGSLSWDMNEATLIVSDSWTGDFTLKVRATNVCGDGAWSDDLMGTVYPSPEPFDVIGGGEICEGGPGLEVELNNSETGVSYELYKNEVATGNIVAGTGEAISFGLITEAGNYTALGFTDYCSTVQYGEASITVSLLPTQLTMPTGTTEVCNNDENDYTTTGVQGSDVVVWSLAPENAGTISSEGMTATISWDNAFEGTASLTVLAENSCGTGPASDPLEILVMASPSPEVTGDDLVCRNEVSVYSTSENAGNTYGWEVIGGTITAGEGTSEITVTWGNTPGQAYVILNESLELGCSAVDSLAVTIDDCTGIEDNLSGNDVKVYPNPAHSTLNLQYSAGEGETVIISVYSAMGQMVLQQQEMANGQKQISVLNVEQLPKGMYVVTIMTTKNEIWKGKFDRN